MMASPLDPDIAYFDTNLDELTARAQAAGKDAVLIFDRGVVDFFDSVEEAAKAGYERFGRKPFLARSVAQGTKRMALASIFPIE